MTLTGGPKAKPPCVQGGSLGWCKAMLSRNGIELTPRGGGMLKRMSELYHAGWF
jgi:hypothetical protein